MPHDQQPLDLDAQYRDDVRELLEAAGWRETAEDTVVADNGALWTETNDVLDSGVDAPDKSWSVAFDSNVPANVIAAVAFVAAGKDPADEIRRLRAELAEAREELAAAVRVSEALYRRLSEEQLAGSALYAALTMPTSQEQRQAALDKFTAVAQQVSGAETRPAVETHVVADDSNLNTLPAWLHQRFGTRGQHAQTWEQMSDDDRAYWEHHARAVRRAVARSGFKDRAAVPTAARPTTGQREDDGMPRHEIWSPHCDDGCCL
ncbi:hypothetical protein ACF1GW_30725 [Streptomyces achromogenes]|uniref:hypothetical protein n=1 Tax=Streptomyces achromogenes TaxID=67255 RepID=UPI0036FA3CF6